MRLICSLWLTGILAAAADTASFAADRPARVALTGKIHGAEQSQENLPATASPSARRDLVLPRRIDFGGYPDRNVLPERFGERHQVLRVTAPATDRGSVEWLANLHQTRRPHGSPCIVKAAARILPLQAAVLEHSAGYAFDVIDQLFVLHIHHDALRQPRAPMVHDRLIAPIIAAEFGQIIGKWLASREQEREAGHTCVERITTNVNEARLRKRKVDEPDKDEV